MKDLFYYSFKGKRKEQILQYVNRNLVAFIEEENVVRFTLRNWYRKIVISCLLYNDLVIIVIVRTVIPPFYEKYSVL